MIVVICIASLAVMKDYGPLNSNIMKKGGSKIENTPDTIFLSWYLCDHFRLTNNQNQHQNEKSECTCSHEKWRTMSPQVLVHSLGLGTSAATGKYMYGGLEKNAVLNDNSAIISKEQPTIWGRQLLQTQPRHQQIGTSPRVCLRWRLRSVGFWME